MLLKHTEVIQSPNNKGYVRLVGEVVYDDAVSSEYYWFEFPEKYSEFLGNSGNPWLACLLPLATTLGQSLQIYKPVDSVLFENVQKLMQIWKNWHPHMHIISIEADTITSEERTIPAKTASFFTGGVDSFFTVLRYRDVLQKVSNNHIDELLYVRGPGIPLNNRDAFLQLRNSLDKAAYELGATLVDAATNFRETRSEQMADYSRLSHGSLFASVALALENRYDKVYLASSGDPHPHKNNERHLPWGSHPDTDPLLSTGNMSIIHDGIDFDRIEKTEFIITSEIAMRTLHVCWNSQTNQNCGNCNKCYRTMIILELFGVLEKFTTFREGAFSVKRVGRIYHEHDYDVHIFTHIQTFALQKGRPDIVDAINRSFKFSKFINPWYIPAKRMIYKLSQKRVVWRFAKVLDYMLRAFVVG